MAVTRLAHARGAWAKKRHAQFDNQIINEASMQRLKRISIAVVGVLLLFFIVGFLLPGAWHAERAVLVRAPAPAVFAYLNNLKNWREWVVSHQQDPDMPMEYSGPDAGVGATSRWRDEYGRGVMKIMHSEAGERIEYRILFDGGESSVEGVLILVPEAGAAPANAGAATRVVWRAAGAVGRNPLQRYFALLMTYRVGNDLEASLQRLEQRLDPKS